MFRRAGRQSRRHPMSGAGGAFVPTQIAGLALWLRADLGVTIVQGPVVATGTTPPAVTMAGTPSSSTNTIVLTCTGAGTNTTATFSWTLNGVAQTPFTAAATVVLTGTGITATFPVGAYTNTPSADTYTSVVTVSAWADQSGTGNNVSQGAAANQATFVASSAGYGSTPVLSFAGSQWLTRSFTIAQSYTTYVVGNLSGAGGSYFGNVSEMFGNGTNTLGIYAGTLLPSSLAGTSPSAMCGSFAGAGSAFYQTSSSAPAVSGNAGAGGISPSIFVGAYDAIATSPLNGVVSEVAIYSGLHSASQRLSFFKYVTARTGIATS